MTEDQKEIARLQCRIVELSMEKYEKRDYLAKYVGSFLGFGDTDIGTLPFSTILSTLKVIMSDESYTPYFSLTDGTMVISRTYENHMTDDAIKKFLFAYANKFSGPTEAILRMAAVRFAELTTPLQSNEG